MPQILFLKEVGKEKERKRDREHADVDYGRTAFLRA